MRKKMRFLHISATVLCIALVCTACKTTTSSHQEQALYAQFAPSDADPLHFSFDWRMGLADTVRAGSALFFRFELPASMGRIVALHVIDRFASQYGISHTPELIETPQKTLGILAFPPEETAQLPAGPYSFAVEVRTDRGKVVSRLLDLRLLPADAAISPQALDNERRRFAALLQLRNDRESFKAVAHLALAQEDDVLARLLRFYQHTALDSLDAYAGSSTVPAGERDIAALALEELRARSGDDLKNDK